MILCEVAVAAPLSNTLTYIFNTNILEEHVTSPDWLIGRRAIVPLGGRRVTGYILGHVGEHQTEHVLKEIISIPDTEPLFHPHEIPFFRWIAKYYHYPIGEVIKNALPAGLTVTSKKVVRILEDEQLNSEGVMFEMEKEPAWFVELVRKREVAFSAIEKSMTGRRDTALFNTLKKEKKIAVETQYAQARLLRKEELCYTTNQLLPDIEGVSTPDRKNIDRFVESIYENSQQRITFAEGKTLYYFVKLYNTMKKEVPKKEILSLYPSCSKILDNLVEKNILNRKKVRVYRNPFGEIPGEEHRVISLTEEQNSAVEKIVYALEQNEFSPFLLLGVTGGGKTEVYLQSARQCLENGKDVLVIVPEIALATQLESHFVSRFKDNVALLHSGLSPGEKYDQWSLAYSGKVKIVIGARSAIFAPLKNVGLIVVDEEHDGGLKQDDGLKYNGRDLAIVRAKFAGCCVVLGSATPSITSYYNSITGKYSLLELRKRVGGSTLPQVDIVDLKAERIQGVFHESFIKQLKRNLAKKEQSLVLLNRRGFSSSLICKECGTQVSCKSCNVNLTYHKKRARLLCHYCGYEATSKVICEKCHSTDLIPYGVGTERVEEELQEIFPEAVIKRLDSDTSSKRKTYLTLLKKMKMGEIDILVGTQMIAKGHHFPNVTFVGVVWADGGLNMPDFRSAERTYQLLSQVTGRAGRGDKKGRVIIQTMRPNHYAIELSQQHRYDLFYSKEIDARKKPAFPPFVRLVRVRIDGENENNVRKTAFNLSEVCRKNKFFNKDTMQLLGPSPAPIEKLRNRFRWQLLVKSQSFNGLHDLIDFLITHSKLFVVGKTQTVFDVDPENMM